jgi:hypothetical protein
MTSTDDAYQFSMDDPISDTPRTRSSSRNRKATSNNIETNIKKKVSNKRTENGQQRVATRSSQKSSITSMNNENDNSFMSNINSGFSQFVNPKKRQRDEKKTTKFKRPRSKNSLFFILFSIIFFF